ncbi:MAG TPA: MBL fold metallo-hydrolase, partial [Chryseosolibacter sp.]|nr:MBL fold metallo-hydrolase [Chryseosolibacter sp.]
HDACDPHSFVVTGNQVRVGVFTDIGSPCEHVIRNFNQCHAAFLESNYDEDLLERGRYPYPLKLRIRGGQGHLSNTQAVELFRQHRPAFMTHLFLSHLSAENNRPKIAEQMFRKLQTKTKIILAPRNRETPVYHISNVEEQRQSQLTLFQ